MPPLREWGRDSERERERERGGSRPFVPDSRRAGGGGSGGFEVPYRSRVNSRKRSRNSSEDESDRGDVVRVGRSRPVSPEWRRGDALDRELNGRARLNDSKPRSVSSESSVPAPQLTLAFAATQVRCPRTVRRFRHPRRLVPLPPTRLSHWVRRLLLNLSPRPTFRSVPSSAGARSLLLARGNLRGCASFGGLEKQE